MRLRTLAAALGVLALAAAGCGESKTDVGGGGGGTGTTYEVVKNPSFAAGSTMDRLAKAGSVKIGVKADQPGLGSKNPSTGQYEGFDIEIARIVAGQLGLAPDKITPPTRSPTSGRRSSRSPGRTTRPARTS